MNKVLHAGMQ